MTTAILNKKIEILNKYSVIPSGLNMPIDWQILDARGTEYEYGSYKYSDSDEFHWNKAVSIQMKHKLMKDPVWLTIFEGANYRETEAQVVVATEDATINENWQIATAEGTVYSTDSIRSSDDADSIEGLEFLVELETAFESKVFLGDETGFYTNGDKAAIANNCNVLADIVNELKDLEFIVIPETIVSRTKLELSKITAVENRLLEIARGRLYVVTVVIDNTIEQYHNHLSKEEAEEKFIEYCKKYYNENGVEQFIEDQNLDDIESMSISVWEEYFHSGAWYDSGDMANVQMNLM